MSQNDKQLSATREIIEHLAQQLDAPFSVRLWDGSCVALGTGDDDNYQITIASAGTLGSLLRRPTIENVLRQYASGNLGFEGGDLIAFAERARAKKFKLDGKTLRKGFLLRKAMPLLFAKDTHQTSHEFGGDETGHQKSQRNEKEFIQFHYDVSNGFYQLFLDPEMQYSCGYFADWENSLEQAQQDKLDMICKKLRLEPGERLLDIGCGWGGLLCHAAKNYGVEAHGVTLSQTQYDFALEKVRTMGLEDQVTLELKPYEELEGQWDKISSIGMYEHVGIATYPKYFGKMRQLLRDRGLFLNHGITRRAKATDASFNKIRPEKRLILKYIFPGSELDHIGHSVQVMEAQKFEVHDVECWREHYALTCRIWHQRLYAKREEAIAHVGEEKYRMWIAYLAGVSLAFDDGTLRIYQTLATKHQAKGPSGMPPTRAHLYEQG